MNRADELREIKERFGSCPTMAARPRTVFVRGVEGIEVDLLDGPMNPYRSLYVMALSTWTHFGDWGRKRWREADVETRIAVVRMVLAAKALPLAMESPKFAFDVSGCSRSSFDQIARARVGVVFASLGSRDNDFSATPFRISEATWRDPARLERKKAAIFAAHAAYVTEIAYRGGDYWSPTFETCREQLPLSVCWRVVMSINFAALRGFCARRMTFSEQSDTVAVAWLIRDRLMKSDAYPLLGAWLRPRCDFVRKCTFHVPGDDSEIFRGLNVTCGRNPLAAPCDYVAEFADHQCPSTDPEAFKAQIGVKIPDPDEERPETFELTERDLELFHDDGPFDDGLSGSPVVYR
jgi:hypothetical protein